jgi:hypothetical protein
MSLKTSFSKNAFCVHRAHELAGVDAIAIVHETAELLAQADDDGGHPWGN